MSGSEPKAGIEAALRDGVVHGSVALDVITVGGTDALDYLQGQLSQNVNSLTVGETRWTLLLQPQGKVEAWMRLHRVDADRLWLVVDAGFGDDALARLERFKLRVDVTMTLDRRVAVGLRGPGSGRAAEQFAPDDGVVVVDAGWGPVPGFDLIPDGGEPPVAESESGFGLAVDDQTMELVRVLQGRPSMGRELDASTIPAAAGVVDRSVDFTKGCYVGQELVARIDSRGNNTPTRLVRVTGSSASMPAVGSPLLAGGTEAGTLTERPGRHRRAFVGLAYVKRAVEVPGQADVETLDGSTAAVELLPLDPPTASDVG